MLRMLAGQFAQGDETSSILDVAMFADGAFTGPNTSRLPERLDRQRKAQLMKADRRPRPAGAE
jgi:hypothetical protein